MPRQAAPKKVIQRRLDKIVTGKSDNKNPAALTTAIKKNATTTKVLKHADKKVTGGYIKRAIPESRVGKALAAAGALLSVTPAYAASSMGKIATGVSAGMGASNASMSIKKINKRYEKNIGLTQRERDLKPMQGMSR